MVELVNTEPKSKAVHDAEDQGGSEHLHLNDVLPQLEKPWFRYKHLVKLNLLLLAGILGQVVSGYDGSMMNGLQSLPAWEEYFDHPTGEKLGTMSVGVPAGQLIVLPFTALSCEYLGRRWTIVLGGVIAILGAALQGAANNFGMFVAGRFIIGGGACFASVAGAALLSECTYPAHRATMVALFQSSWSFGSFIAALVTWGCYNSATLQKSTWSWRIPSLLQAALPIAQLAIALIGPESPRWLVSRDKIEKAEEFFIKYQAGGDRDAPLVKYQMAEVIATIEAEKIQKQSSWLEWFQSKAMLHRFFLVIAVPAMMQLLGNAIISYYLHLVLNNVGITDAITQLKINIGMTAWGNVCSIISSTVVGRFKRRHMLLLGFSLLCGIYTLFTLLSALNEKHNYEIKGYGIGVVTMIYLFQGAYHISSIISPLYTSEITPFSLRAKGQALTQASGGLCSLFNNYVNPIAMERIGWRYYIFWTCWIAVQITVVYFFVPETNGLALEEIAQVFGDALVDTEETVNKVAAQPDHYDDDFAKEKGTAAHVEHSK